MQKYKITLTTSKFLEDLLISELNNLNIKHTKQAIAKVDCELTLSEIYQVSLSSRIANRVLLNLKQTTINNADDLYNKVYEIDWQNLIKENATIAVDFSGTNNEINNSHFGSLKTKDAIVDKFLSQKDIRLNVDSKNADIKIFVYLKNNLAHISLDLSGESLHKRGLRLAQGEAPIKENIASAMLMRAKSTNYETIIDVACGSGTILIEAAQIALNIPANINRDFFGFHFWQEFDEQLFIDIKNNLKSKIIHNENLKIYGFDNDKKVLSKAYENIINANLDDYIFLDTKNIEDLENNLKLENGLIISNLPFGKRIGEVEDLKTTYEIFGNKVKQFSGFKIAVLSSEMQLLNKIKMKVSKQYKMFNGAIECFLNIYEIFSEQLRDDLTNKEILLNENAQMVFNRLEKNHRKLKVLSKTTNAYRIYDSDIPEFAVAIDVYDDKVYLQEYQAPKSIDATKAKQRLNDAIAATKKFFNLKNKDLIVKQRKAQKGLNQYEKTDDKQNFFTVFEQLDENTQAKFLVNLNDYIDTGLFLDNRLMRRRIFKEAKGRKFLNLFCYTSSVSICAALGKATSSTSVDLSKTYLNWSEKNAKLNKISENHKFINDDVFKFLKNAKINNNNFDLIFLDPPTFSNSKKTENDFDIQKSHFDLICQTMQILNAKGILYFQNNYTKFKLDERLNEMFNVENISLTTIDIDFERNKKIHSTFKITSKS